MISKEDIEGIAKIAGEAAARATVPKVLQELGIDTKDVLETQQDMAHLRRWRRGVEAGTRWAIFTTIGLFVTGVAGAVWAFVGKH